MTLGFDALVAFSYLVFQGTRNIALLLSEKDVPGDPAAIAGDGALQTEVNNSCKDRGNGKSQP